ncbi:Uncharacterised protein [Bordetella pertussis]|nr:Uncharacterised protein [Bordetella pertussis]CFM75061.1 Uncharacterised protein [Bordetella pertussis]CFN15212.1 Uncharacterised protein [Bordetella pertussis]CFN37122.1 Uncharacterised protein [Bordetella pertussis]CFN92738.1 Uncharacterised protein [Bordetella pertussis]
MGGGEIDAAPGPPVAVVEHVARGGQARRQRAGHARVAAPEAPRGVAELVVPLGHAGRVAAQLVAVGADVPGFGNQLDARQHRILQQGVEKAAAGIEAGTLAAQGHAQVEAKAVDAVVDGPMAQRVHDHLQHARMRQVEGVAGARVVDVAAFVAGPQPVIAGVVEPAPRQRGTEFVAFAGVVVDHVQDDFDAGRVQAADGAPQVVGLAVGQIGRLGREVRQGVVAPVVAQPAFDQGAVLQEGMHRHQFQRGDAQPVEMVDEAGVGQGGAGAADGFAQVAAQHGHAAHVRFVDDRVRPRRGGAPRCAPVERRLGHHGFGHAGGAVAPVHAEVGARVLHAVAEQRVRPAQRAGQGGGVRVEQQLVRIEAMAGARVVRTVGAIAVDQARLRVGQVAVPHLVGAFGHGQARQLLAAARVEQAKLDARGVGREHGEIHAQAVAGGAQRGGQAGQQSVGQRRIHGFTPSGAGTAR